MFFSIFAGVIVIFSILLTIYSKEKFDTYNFFRGLYSISILSENNKVVKINSKLYLLYPGYEHEYINTYLNYHNLNWEATRYNEAGCFEFCDENYCFGLKIDMNKFFGKRYSLLKEGELYKKK